MCGKGTVIAQMGGGWTRKEQRQHRGKTKVYRGCIVGRERAWSRAQMSCRKAVEGL